MNQVKLQLQYILHMCVVVHHIHVYIFLPTLIDFFITPFSNIFMPHFQITLSTYSIHTNTVYLSHS